GVAGILRVMHSLGMVAQKGVPKARGASVMCADSHWFRAPAGGLFRGYRAIGDAVEEGTVLAAISDPFGETDIEVTCDGAGIVIGRSNMPMVYEGEALFHVASTPRAEVAANGVAAQMDAAPLFDE